jgi:hypothetical protein
MRATLTWSFFDFIGYYWDFISIFNIVIVTQWLSHFLFDQTFFNMSAISSDFSRRSRLQCKAMALSLPLCKVIAFLLRIDGWWCGASHPCLSPPSLLPLCTAVKCCPTNMVLAHLSLSCAQWAHRSSKIKGGKSQRAERQWWAKPYSTSSYSRSHWSSSDAVPIHEGRQRREQQTACFLLVRRCRCGPESKRSMRRYDGCRRQDRSRRTTTTTHLVCPSRSSTHPPLQTANELSLSRAGGRLGSIREQTSGVKLRQDLAPMVARMAREADRGRQIWGQLGWSVNTCSPGAGSVGWVPYWLGRWCGRGGVGNE